MEMTDATSLSGGQTGVLSMGGNGYRMVDLVWANQLICRHPGPGSKGVPGFRAKYSAPAAWIPVTRTGMAADGVDKLTSNQLLAIALPLPQNRLTPVQIFSNKTHADEVLILASQSQRQNGGLYFGGMPIEPVHRS